MKASKWLRIISLAVVLCLVMVPVVSVPALAADYDIEIQDEDKDDEIDSGEIGDYVYIIGDDWPESGDTEETSEYVDIYFTSVELEEDDDIDDADAYEKVKSGYYIDEDGDFEAKVKIPDRLEDGDDEDDDEDVNGGTYYFCVTMENSDDIKAVAEFTVIAAEIELDPEEGYVGEEVEITGVDFAEDADLTVDLDGEEIDIEDGDDAADDDGEFSLTVYIPETTAGEHTITVTDDEDNSATAVFTVEPEITLDKSNAAAGDTITVYGTGFGTEVDVAVEFDGTEMNSYQTDDYGSFQLTFKVPVKSSGSYDVEARDEDKNKAETSLTIAAGISLSPVNGNVGTQVTVSGNGFTPNSSVNVTYAGAAVTSATADSSGKVSASFTVPESQAGAQAVTASDGSNTASATFTMESVPPSAPSANLPLADDKAKSAAYFDWGDVTDDSGVTYTLQISDNQSFSSLVLEKTGIADSEYTLTDEEKLPSTKKDAPYYWRVQAVDGAGNESGWTTASAFYVGFSMSFPTWAWWVVGALAAILIILVGFLLGRRTSYM